MRAETMTPAATEAADRKLYQVGGISAIVLGVAYISIFPLYAYVGAPPSGGEAWLTYLAGKTTVWWAILGLSVLTDFLFIPFALSLYVALKDIDRSAMLVATALVGLFVVLDLGVTWSSIASLLTLSDHYAAATTDTQRVAYVAAASHASAVLASRLGIVYAILVLSLAILIIGFVMLRGIFSKATAYLGLATGLLGLIAVAGSGVSIILNAVLATIWILFSGHRLYRLARP